jgi:hypothetical protein
MKKELEIIYRGICTDSTNHFFGEFIYGDLIDFVDGGTYIRMSNYKNNCFIVNPDTVGQFIGKLDIHGNKIFKGDFDSNYDVIDWCDKRCGWSLFTYNHPTKEYIHCNCYSCEGNFEIRDVEDEIEIKGNIYNSFENFFKKE